MPSPEVIADTQGAVVQHRHAIGQIAGSAAGRIPEPGAGGATDPTRHPGPGRGISDMILDSIPNRLTANVSKAKLHPTGDPEKDRPPPN